MRSWGARPGPAGWSRGGSARTLGVYGSLGFVACYKKVAQRYALAMALQPWKGCDLAPLLGFFLNLAVALVAGFYQEGQLPFHQHC